MKIFITKKIFSITLAAILVSLAWMIPVHAKDTNVDVKNSVRSSASTGGNSGENVETGSASARSSVKTETNNNSDETNVKVDASAEANGEKVEISEEFTGGDMNIQKETEDGEASISVDVEIETQNTGNGTQSIEREERNMEQDDASGGIIKKTASAIGSFFRKIFLIFS